MKVQLVSGQIFADKFRLEGPIGSGGMGVVWRAWNLQLDIPVAIKVMTATFARHSESAERFEREAKAAARIRGRHVVNIYEHGVHEQLAYMVMELLEGEDLNQRLKREGRLSLRATARIVSDLCKALQRAHDLGIVHRDLKPANIFLTRDGDEEIAKVLDFGIAKLMHASEGGFVSVTGQMLGTPTYMSPEQIRATKHVDARADLWSLAVIAFRALTGAFPFSGSMFDITSGILKGRTPVASAAAPDLSPEVDAFFARAMASNINHRFQSARDMSNALSVLSGDTVLISAAETLLPQPPTDDVPGSEKTTERHDGQSRLPSAALAADQERPIDEVTLSDRTTQRRHDDESKPSPAALAADLKRAVDEVTVREHRHDGESKPSPSVLAADQKLAARRPAHTNLADATPQRVSERAGRSRVAWLVILSVIIIIGALLAVAFWTRPDH
ncbi:MAG: serine/threonine-protein kinase [Byssovorax sp.]